MHVVGSPPPSTCIMFCYHLNSRLAGSIEECLAPVQVRHKVTGRQYALKVVDKHLVLRHRLVGQLRQERNILDRCAHPAVARLHFTFQDEGAVYLGLELCPNGPQQRLLSPNADGRAIPNPFVRLTPHCCSLPARQRKRCRSKVVCCWLKAWYGRSIYAFATRTLVSAWHDLALSG